MTDNIQKLYEITGVERIYSEFNNDRETVVERVFSPYKQLELIKKVLEKGLLQINRSSLGNIQFCNFGNAGDYKAEFDEALASFVIDLWQDLSDDQKQEIKEILK